MEVFIAHKNDILDRFNPLFILFKLSFKVNSKFTLIKLGELLISPPQYGANERAIDGDPNFDYRYIRITDIDEFGLLKNGESKTVENVEDKYILHPDDILFARSGATAGKCFIFTGGMPKSIFAGYLIRYVFDKSKVFPRYVFYLSQIHYYKTWVSSIQRPSGQPNINSEEFKSFEVPLPPIPIQEKIIQVMDDAYSKKRHNEEEAERLYNSIDDYLLKELGIDKVKFDIKNYFSIDYNHLFHKRIDPFYHQPIFEENEQSILNGRYGVSYLNQIRDLITSGQRPKGGVRQITEGIPSLGGEHINDLGFVAQTKLKYITLEFHKTHLSSKVFPKDILLVKDGATTGKVGFIPEDYPLEEANINEHLFLIRIKNEYDPFYIFSFLKSSPAQIQIKGEITGATITGLVRESVENFKIPIPPIEIQKNISQEIKNRIEKAEALKEEGKNYLEQAKKEVEKILFE